MWWKVSVIVLLVHGAELISTGRNPQDVSLEMLWNLTNLALQQTNLQGRQGGYGYGPPIPQNGQYQGYLGNGGVQPPQYQAYAQNQPYQGYPASQSPQSYPPYQGYPQSQPHGPYQGYPSQQISQPNGPYQGYPPQGVSPLGNLLGFQTPQNPHAPASIMDVLQSVAQNDELHCVPKLLCELTSNTRSRGEQSSLLPFNVNMDSLLGLFSAFGPGSNPLFLFGRAALLGYTSRGSSCYSAFSRCPNDPDQLVNYLNNYNGGFFRYFNGNPRPQYEQGAYYAYGRPQPQRPQYQGYPQYYAPQKRILTNSITSKYPSEPCRFPYAAQYDHHDYDGGNRLRGIRFPADDVAGNSIDTPQRHKSGKSLTFPGQPSGNEDLRAGRTLSFPDAHYRRGLDFQMVRPNHVASPHIFPTRTGTGELLLDPEELH